MNEKLTLSMLTREFVRLLSHMIELQFSPEPHSFITGQRQQHADIVILPEHLKTKSLEDVSDELLMPAACQLAEKIKANHAAVTFELPPPPNGVECSIHRFNGCCIRGMVMRDVEMDGLIVDAFRFDVLYREVSLQ